MYSNDLCDEVLTALRRIIRAVELQSRQLVRNYGLTGPQIFILKTLSRLGESTVGKLADQVNLSKPTVTDILNRLEKYKLVKRVRSDTDKRCVRVTVTEFALQKLASSPPLLQEEFALQFRKLKKWEQFQLITSLEKIAEMMDVKDLDASPILSSGPITLSPDITEITRATSVGARNANKRRNIKKTG